MPEFRPQWNIVPTTQTRLCLDGDLLHTYYPLHIIINHKYFYLQFNI